MASPQTERESGSALSVVRVVKSPCCYGALGVILNKEMGFCCAEASLLGPSWYCEWYCFGEKSFGMKRKAKQDLQVYFPSSELSLHNSCFF